MNIYTNIRDKTGTRILILLAIAGLAGFALGGLVAAVWAIAITVAAPTALGVAAFFWTAGAEWTKLGVAELYGTAAQQKMEAAARQELRETLDAIGQEAFDELERAIARRDESEEA